MFHWGGRGALCKQLPDQEIYWPVRAADLYLQPRFSRLFGTGTVG